MKIRYQHITWLLPVLLFAACKKDNYEAPRSKFTGAILYQGDTINVASRQVNFELWQSGFGKLTPVNVNIAEDGSFSALLFNGGYKLDFPSGQGPFMSDKIDTKTNGDTITVEINGNTSLNIEVMPYYMIRNTTITGSGNTVSATCQVEKIITDANAKDIENVTLYLSKTNFADNNNNIAIGSVNGVDIPDMNNISLQATVPDLIPSQDYVFARIGLKVKNVEDRMYSPIIKIALK